MRILFTSAPGYGLMLPVVPLIWAARAAGHEVLLATASEMTDVGARAGLPVVDVFPDRDVWQELMRGVVGDDRAGLSAEYARAAESGNPFGLFTLTMTEGTIEAGRAFGADLVVFTSDHAAGRITAQALGVPGLEVGNRVSWSLRDTEFRENHNSFDGELERSVMRELGVADGDPRLVARIDPRPASMGGLKADEPDSRDGVPWWPMRFVPFNGGAVLPAWAMRAPQRPRVCVTLGRVVPAISGTTNLEMVVEALGGMDLDVVLAAGTADLTALGTLPENVRSVGFLPLSAFLPSCSLIVHHGGSGTTAAPLHYGVPQLVLPAFADNPLSAKRVADRGVGLSLDPATADVATVREMVRRLLDEPGFSSAAAEVAEEMAGQPSPSEVVERVAAALS
ncbi:DUF1205 domain-containing protein [Saccharopolyspora erythraea]|uniref:nucleotide disphospho-sugar-binding domain-containing protein n=1 Tax=Saccharopolyspora erythraea TaxID=1836 RepID=UPI001BA54A5A|nr:nucleotide disphospho-sugar-binding domain-containing protein [Saccharopolyspora erythraea]QUH04619.1 DUF1205 domain-containing protein [Saccharopolyspora erythraea]